MQTDLAIKVCLGSTHDAFHASDDCVHVEHYRVADPNVSLARLVRENSNHPMTTSLGSGAGTFIVASRDSELRLEQNGRVLFQGLMVERSVIFVEGPGAISLELQSDASFYVLTFLNKACNRSVSVTGGRFNLRDGRLSDLVDRILESSPTRRSALVSDFSTLAFERYRSLPRVHPLCAWRLSRVIRHLESRLDRQTSLAELAFVAGFSRAHFAATFKAATSISAHEFILRMRVQAAAKLLACTDLALVEIALQTGFQNQPHFTTVFRKLTSMTPRRWRDTYRLDQAANAANAKKTFPGGSRIIEHVPQQSSDLH